MVSLISKLARFRRYLTFWKGHAVIAINTANAIVSICKHSANICQTGLKMLLLYTGSHSRNLSSY